MSLLVRAVVLGLSVLAVASVSEEPTAEPGRRMAAGEQEPKRPPKPGVKVPDVQVPMTSLIPEAAYEVGGTPDWLAADEAMWVSNKPADSVSRLNPASNTFETFPVGKRPCSGLAVGFGSVWVPLCGDGSTPQGLARVDLKSGKVVATLPVKVGHTEGGLATGAGSVWMMTDAKGTLARIDPDTNAVVAEVYVAPGSYAVAFGEKAVWVTSTDKSLVTRVNPETNLVEASIAVGPSPRFLTVGEGGVWTLNQGDGSVTRIDPATNKVVATIEVGVPGGGGEISAGEGSVWVTAFEFPVSRIDPATNKVVQQFSGEGGDAIRVGVGWLWLSNLAQGNVWRLDPRRVEATRK